ncbi:MAG: hypothetical protein ABI639_02465 [Thermoanaerobaculia bacterium]
MKILRSVLAVISGYAIFAAGAFAFFRISGQAPHQPAPVSIMIASIAVGVLCALLGGYAAARLAGRRPLAHGIAVAVILELGALASLVSTLGHGAIWTQVSALVLMSPAAALGGWLRSR